MKEGLHDVPLLCWFAGLDAVEDIMPNESTILRFQYLLEKHALAEVNSVLSEKGLSIKHGMVMDRTLIAAPNSTKKEDKKRNPEMTQTKKSNQRRFGIKTSVGIDDDSDLSHIKEYTTEKVAGIMMMGTCLHSEKTLVLGDQHYHKKNRTVNNLEKENDLSVLIPTKKPTDSTLPDDPKAFNRILSAVQEIEMPAPYGETPVWFYKGSLSWSGEEYRVNHDAVCAGQYVADAQAIAAIAERGSLVNRNGRTKPWISTANSRKLLALHLFMT